jgi:hypothetical protein
MSADRPALVSTSFRPYRAALSPPQWTAYEHAHGAALQYAEWATDRCTYQPANRAPDSATFASSDYTAHTQADKTTLCAPDCSAVDTTVGTTNRSTERATEQPAYRAPDWAAVNAAQQSAHSEAHCSTQLQTQFSTVASTDREAKSAANRATQQSPQRST